MIRQYTPMAPTLVRAPFHRAGWIDEEKVDGYRMLANKDGARVRLVSRNGVDHTSRYPHVAAAVARLKPSTLARKNVAPLRVADLVLWLLRRHVERDDGIPHDSAALLQWVDQRSHYYEISRQQLSKSILQGLVALSKLKITPEQEARGREIVARLVRERREHLGRR